MWMRAKLFDRVVSARQLGFVQGRMNFFVADVMKQHRGTTLAAFQLWNEMVSALRDIRRNGAAAKRTDRIGHGFEMRPASVEVKWWHNG